MKSTSKIWLIVIFLLIFGTRIFLAMQIPTLDYEAYSVIRQVENIKHTGLPLFEDDLSYSGRTHIFSPVYHYVLAIFSFIMPLELVAKIIPNLLAALTLIVVFFIVKNLTEDETIALLTAGISGIIPVFFNNTINNASIYSAVVPLFFLTIYYFISTLKDESNVTKLLITMILITIIHPASFILALSLLLYILLVKIQGFRESRRAIELVLFFLFFVFWVNMIIYKNAFLFHKESIIWQNMPSLLLSHSFAQVTFLESILSIGAIPLIFGLVSIYLTLFTTKRKTLTLLLSVCAAIFILIWLQYSDLFTGLTFLGVALCIMSAEAFKRLYDSSKLLKLKYGSKYFLIITIMLALIAFVPNINYFLTNTDARPSQEDIQAFVWLGQNIPKNSTVLAYPNEGGVMSFFSQRKNVIDEDFLLIPNINTRYKDTTDIYKQRFLTSALETLNYYGVDYIILTTQVQNKVSLNDLMFVDQTCFTKLYPKNNQTQEPIIYKVNCVLNSV